jgi:hypothetical protein
MQADNICPGIDKCFDISSGMLDHQVSFDRQFRQRPDRLNDDGADRDIGDKVSVHYIDMELIDAGILAPADLVRQFREIRAKDADADFDVFTHVSGI